MKGQVMERGQRCEARGHEGGDEAREGEARWRKKKKERKRERELSKERDEVRRNGGREHTRHPEL